MRDAPLEGVRVLDAARGAAGAHAACVLGDLGADVIAVEEPGTGSPLRSQAPFLGEGRSAVFLAFNRNKRGITLQLGHPSGRRIFSQLLERSDVLIHNVRPGLLRTIGASRAVLKGLRPGLITCSVSPFGTSGPYAEIPAAELVVEALAGLLPREAGQGGTPQALGLRVASIVSGLHAAVGIIAALRQVAQGGEGQDLEVSSFDSLIAAMGSSVLGTLYASEESSPGGFEPAWSPADIFATRDDPIVLVAAGERAWRQTCNALDLGSLWQDPRFESNEKRVRHRQELHPILAEKLAERTAAEWLEDLRESGVAASRVASPWEVVTDPHLAARGVMDVVPDTLLGDLKVVRNPIRQGGEPAKVSRSAPLLGEHNGEILGQMLGYSRGELKRLRLEKVI